MTVAFLTWGGMAALAGGPSGGPMSLMSGGAGGALASMEENHGKW